MVLTGDVQTDFLIRYLRVISGERGIVAGGTLESTLRREISLGGGGLSGRRVPPLQMECGAGRVVPEGVI